MLINVKDPADEAFTKALIAQFNEVDTSFQFIDNNASSGSKPEIQHIKFIINVVFDVLIVLTMFLCFFALSANMSANIFDQTKEIAVLRSIGYKKCRIISLYFYEALVLVLASSMLGVLIGVFVGYAFLL